MRRFLGELEKITCKGIRGSGFFLKVVFCEQICVEVGVQGLSILSLSIAVFFFCTCAWK